MKRIAIVTGASSGIGKAFFLSLNERKEGLDEIWVIARSADKLNELQTLTDVPVRTFALDLSKSQSFDVLNAALREETPSVKYLICASGFGRFTAVLDDDLHTLENMVDLNCRAIVSGARVVAPYMEKDGLIMLVSSVAAFQPIPYIATYGATKSFVLSFGRAFNRELMKSRGARCMCVCPFWTKTEFFKRAVEKDTPVVKKYVAMYEPHQIVSRAWKDAKKKKEFSMYGFKAKAQTLLTKLLPHKWVMSVWMKQQKL